MQFGFGAGVFYGTRNDIANGSPVRFGAMQDIGIDFDADIKTLYGQSQYALDSARAKTKITGKIKFAQLNAALYSNLYFGTAATAGQIRTVYNEEITASAVVPGTTNAVTALGNPTLHFASTPAGVVVGATIADSTTPSVIPTGTYVLAKTGTTVTMSANATGAGVGSGDVIHFGPSMTVANQADFLGDLGLYYAADGTALTFVVGNPAAGEYTENDGVYSVNSADASKELLVNYMWTDSSSGFTIEGGNPLMGNTPRFQGVFSQEYGNNGTTLILYSCTSGKLSIPTKLDDYTIQDLDFEAFANSAGRTFTLSLGT